MTDLVSVIIPVYNTSVYLRECLDSVAGQTYRGLQILVIDDGSNDGSGEIADSYAAADERFTVMHRENGGPSAARNAALKEATGKYIFCIDSDDVIEPETIETLVKICNETGSELCISSYRRFKDPYIRQSYPEMHSSILDAKEATRRMTCDMGFTHSSCGKLYLRSLWEGITFPEGKIYEDYQTTFKLIARAEKVAYCDARFYCYRIRSGSIMRTKVQEINIELLDISSVVTEELTRLYPDMEEIILYQKARTYLRLMKNILNAGFDVFPDAQQRIISYIKSEKENLLASSVVKKVDKIKVRTLCMGRRVFYLAYKIGNLKNRNMQD